MEWRRIEKVLIDYARKEELKLDESPLSDKCIVEGDWIVLNLTNLAQHLARELTNDPSYR